MLNQPVLYLLCIFICPFLISLHHSLPCASLITDGSFTGHKWRSAAASPFVHTNLFTERILRLLRAKFMAEVVFCMQCKGLQNNFHRNWYRSNWSVDGTAEIELRIHAPLYSNTPTFQIYLVYSRNSLYLYFLYNRPSTVIFLV